MMHSLSAQFMEFGGGIGGLNYSGDMIRTFNITTMKPAFTGHYRLNFSEYLSLKWGLAIGNLGGSDENPIDALAAERNRNFNITLAELSSSVEYHFLDYKHDKSPIKWSPYAFGGIGFTRLYRFDQTEDKFSKIQAVIPFGIGFKHLVGKRFAIELESGMRKTFFDYLDGVSDSNDNLKDFQYGNPSDNDWYFFTALRLSFIIYEIPCPFPYIPNKHMLRANFR